MNDIKDLDGILRAFAGSFALGKRRQLMRRIANELAKINRRRMSAQKSPDGDAWEARKTPPRNGGSKKMMDGLKRKMQVRHSLDRAAIGFYAKTGAIALIHHRGLNDIVSEGGPSIQYAMRELIGFADGDLDLVERIILETIKL